MKRITSILIGLVIVLAVIGTMAALTPIAWSDTPVSVEVVAIQATSVDLPSSSISFGGDVVRDSNTTPNLAGFADESLVASIGHVTPARTDGLNLALTSPTTPVYLSTASTAAGGISAFATPT